MSEAAVQERAYSLWEQDPSRSSEQNWHLAKAQLESEALAAQPGPALFKTAETATAPGRKRLSTVSARHQLLAPTTNDRVPIEYSVHKVLPRMKEDLQRVFPDVDITNCLIIPTFQKCNCDLVASGPVADAEKDRLLENFVDWAKACCETLQAKGHWADLTDPCSGYPVYGERGPGWYPDVIGSQMLLRYDMIDTGCCKLISHPDWQTQVYPATLFTSAPYDLVLEALAV